MTIGKQIGVCLGGLMLACTGIGVTSWYYVTALGNRVDEAVTVTARKLELTGELTAGVFTFREDDDLAKGRDDAIEVLI